MRPQFTCASVYLTLIDYTLISGELFLLLKILHCRLNLYFLDRDSTIQSPLCVNTIHRVCCCSEFILVGHFVFIWQWMCRQETRGDNNTQQQGLLWSHGSHQPSGSPNWLNVMLPLVTVARSDKLYSRSHITPILWSRVRQCSAEGLYNMKEGYIHDVKFEVIPVTGICENKRKP